MKNLKLKGRYRHYGKAWLGKGMYKKDIRPVQERAICAVLLKHSGLWKCVQEKALPLPDEMKILVKHMFRSFTYLKDRAKSAKAEALLLSAKQSKSSFGNESKLESKYTESKIAGSEKYDSGRGMSSKQQENRSISLITMTLPRVEGRRERRSK